MCDNAQCTTLRPPKLYSLSSFITSTWLPMDSFTSPPSSAPSMSRPTKPGRRVGSTRERLGCLTCRHRRKKCDELYPICGHCKRLNLVCKREEPRQVVPVHDDAESTAIVRRQSPSKLPKVMDIWSLDPERSQDRRAMLGYYTSVLAVLLTTNHDNNSFLSVFLPMAIESKPLQMSLVAWSSAHLSRLSKTHEITALENRSSALVHVSSSLYTTPTTPSDFDTMLASCLVLCAAEIALGDTENWYRHLQGARQIIIAARGKNGKTGAQCFMGSRDGQWLLRNFAYHDVLGSVTSSDGPLLKGAYWINPDATETVVDSYIGIGSGILELLSEISELATTPPIDELQMDIQMDEMDADENPDFWKKADELEVRLRQWQRPECSEPNLVELAEAYRCSAFIVLYRKQRAFISGQPQMSLDRSHSDITTKIAQAVDHTLLHIQQVPIQSLPECGLLFPLFMVGGDTLDAKIIETVRSRVQSLLKDRGFGNIGKAQEVLEELWRLRVTGAKGPEGRELDWMDIVQSKGWRLILS